MSAPLDELYFTWLYANIGSLKVKNPTRTHWRMARQLYTKEFVWFIPYDENRAADGQDLRLEFMADYELDEIDAEWMEMGCSMLEMLVALAKRIAFQADGMVFSWFWEMIENMGIRAHESSDQHYDERIAQIVDNAMNRVIERTYASDGQGGLFPIPGTLVDQRELDIWYQMNAYLMSDL